MSNTEIPLSELHTAADIHDEAVVSVSQSENHTTADIHHEEVVSVSQTPSVSFATGCDNVENSSSSSTASTESKEEDDIPAQDEKIAANSNVIFKVQGRLVHACKGVLSLLSPVFESMFKVCNNYILKSFLLGPEPYNAFL